MKTKRMIREKGAMKELAGLFGLTPESIRRHLRGEVRTVQTRAIVEYAREHYSVEWEGGE